MKHLLVAALLFAPLPALAEDSITITVHAGAGAALATETWAMSPEDMAKFQEWIASAYQCSPQPSCTALTPNEAASAWAQATLQGTIDNVTRYEKIKAASEAVADVPPINPVMKK